MGDAVGTVVVIGCILAILIAMILGPGGKK
jgi:hypothetical protein